MAATLERLISISPGKKQYWVQLAAVQNHLEQDAKALATLRLADSAELLSEDREFRQLARLLFLRDLPFQCAQVIEAAIAAGTREGRRRRLPDAVELLHRRPRERARARAARQGGRARAGRRDVPAARPDAPAARALPSRRSTRCSKALAKAKPEQRGSVQLLIGVAQLGSERFDDAERAFRPRPNDAKVGDAARSYLEFVQEQRAPRAARAGAARAVAADRAALIELHPPVTPL